MGYVIFNYLTDHHLFQGEAQGEDYSTSPSPSHSHSFHSHQPAPSSHLPPFTPHHSHYTQPEMRQKSTKYRAKKGRCEGGRSEEGRSEGGSSEGGRSEGRRSEGRRSEGGRCERGRSEGGRSDGGRSEEDRRVHEERFCGQQKRTHSTTWCRVGERQGRYEEGEEESDKREPSLPWSVDPTCAGYIVSSKILYYITLHVLCSCFHLSEGTMHCLASMVLA